MKQKITSLSIAGLSAIGIPALTLIIRYFKPLKKIVAIDPDTWKPKQLYKHICSQQSDVGEPKVKIARNLIKAYNHKIGVIPLQLQAHDAKAEKAMLTTQGIISCVDNDETRLDLQIFAALHQKILLDMSAQIIGDQRIGTIRLYAPKKISHPCLICQGLDLYNVMSDTLREAQIKTGYLRNSKQNPRSIPVLDSAVASIGTALLIDFLQGRDVPTTLSYNQTQNIITKLKFKKRKNCKICNPSPDKEKLVKETGPYAQSQK